MKTKKPEPKARFCGCGREDFRAGRQVYVKAGPSLTTNKAEAHAKAKGPVGKLVKRGDQVIFELNAYGHALVAI